MSFSGGRSAAKTHEVAEWILLKSIERQRVIVCAREIEKSLLDESALPLLRALIKLKGLDWQFSFANNKLLGLNGSVIMFKGLQEHLVERTAKSFYHIDILWIDEAQTITHKSLDVIEPTIRESGSQIVYTWNNRHKSDAVYKRFYDGEPPPNSYAYQVYWWQNKYLSQTAIDRLRYRERIDPEGFKHIFGGDFLKENEGLHLFNRDRLFEIYEHSTTLDVLSLAGSTRNCAGLDIADLGADTNVWCFRTGSVVRAIEEWSKAAYIKRTVARSHNLNITHNVDIIYYDATGIGAGAKGDFAQLSPRYAAVPFLGAARPRGADRDYLKRITNGQYFMNLKAQAWWNIRQRYENTLIYMLDKASVRKNKFLLFDKTVKKDAVYKLIDEMGQVQYNQDNKLKIDKSPKGTKSPNMADALVLAFCSDISKRQGLKA